MNSIQNIKVYIQFSREETLVGELVKDKQDIYFRYSTDFLKTGYQLSPYKLPLDQKIFTSPSFPFEGIFGVFDDSLPDGWGRMLLDRKLLKQGINPQEIGVLDRLAMIGDRGSGALVYKPVIADEESHLLINLDHIAQDSQKLEEETSAVALDILYRLGGTSGGARPKILVGYNPFTDQIVPDSNKLGEDFEHWIIKFPSKTDLPDIANVEFAYYLMAKDAGIEMSECKLLKGLSGKSYFATKRFDRNKNNRLHLISVAGLLHDNFRRSSLDYGHIMDAAFSLERDIKVYDKVLRLAAFNIFAHNRDDHSKNFSFLMDAKGNWKFAPAYDLTFSSSSHGMHSTTVAGEGEKPNAKHLLTLAKEFNVKDASHLIENVKSIVACWKDYAIKSEVSSESMLAIGKKLLG